MKTIQISDDVYERAAELAEADNLSVDSLFEAMVNQHASDWSKLQARAARGSLDKLHRVLSKVSDTVPETADQF